MSAEASILNLNDDCLEKICRNLSDEYDQLDFARTCERFYFVFKRLSKVQYANFNTRKISNWLPCDIKMFLQIVGPDINTLKIGRNLPAYTLKLLGLYCTNVENLVLYMVNSKKLMSEMIKNMQLLQNLEVTYCVLNDAFMGSLVGLNNLRSLDIEANHKITGGTIHLLSGLEKLSIRYCRNVTSWHFKNICKNLKHLKYLDIRDCEFLKTEDYNHISSYLLQLETLSFTTTQENFISIARLPQLKRLEIYSFGCHLFSQFFEELAMYQAEQLEELHLDISNMNVDIFPTFAKLKKLRVLFLLEFDVTMVPLFSHLTELEVIDFRISWEVTDEHVLHILEKCLKLESITLGYSIKLSPDFLHKVLKLLKVQHNRNLRTERVHIVFSENMEVKMPVEDYANVLKFTNYVRSTVFTAEEYDSSNSADWDYEDLEYSNDSDGYYDLS